MSLPKSTNELSGVVTGHGSSDLGEAGARGLVGAVAEQGRGSPR